MRVNCSELFPLGDTGRRSFPTSPCALPALTCCCISESKCIYMLARKCGTSTDALLSPAPAEISVLCCPAPWPATPQLTLLHAGALPPFFWSAFGWPSRCRRRCIYTYTYTLSATRTPPAPPIIDINFAVANMCFSWACTTHSAPRARPLKHHISATEPRISRAYNIVELMAGLMISSESASCQGVRTAL